MLKLKDETPDRGCVPKPKVSFYDFGLSVEGEGAVWGTLKFSIFHAEQAKNNASVEKIWQLFLDDISKKQVSFLSSNSEI